MENKMKPMFLGESLLFFCIPGVILYWNIYYGVPILDEIGIPLIVSFPLALYGLLGMLLFASIIAYRLEGNPMTIRAFKLRFRLTKVNKKMLLVSLGTIILLQVFEGVLMKTGRFLAQFSFFSPPEILPSFINPNLNLQFPPKEFMGESLSGNYWIILIWAVCLLCNILGEEFWWRGYILPRQELAFGKFAWLIHGVLLLLVFHAFLKWNYIVMIPVCLLLPYLAQKYRNTWLPAIVHGVGNGLIFVYIIAGVMN